MNYYYLISGLPDITRDVVPQQIDFDEVFDTIQRNLNDEDSRIFKYLILPNDNRNLLNHIFQKFHGVPIGEFVLPAIIPQQSIDDYHRHANTFPDYMVAFIDQYEDQFATISMRETEEALNSKFEEEIINVNDAFILNYTHFNKALGQLAFALNASYYDFIAKSEADLNDTLMNQIGVDKGIPSTVLRDYPFVETLSEAVQSQNPLALEQLIDKIKWEYLEGINEFFTRDQVFAYTLKLLMIQRWAKLDQQKNNEGFESLISNIKSSLYAKQTVVV
ncbi:MAG: DUF2764 family protein [Bacteroidota bacterium]